MTARAILYGCAVLTLASAALVSAQSPPSFAGRQVKQLKVTILSTMLADEGIGEWGFAALVEADGRKILVDTGARHETVLANARELKIDLSQVSDVVLTHFHEDHIGGLITLRTEMQQRNPAALSRAHVATGIFYSRTTQSGGEKNPIIALRPQFLATGGQFVEHSRPGELIPGVYLTGPVPRPFPEHNYGDGLMVHAPAGTVEDYVPDDQSVLVNTAEGLVAIVGCGHAGIVNILTDAAELSGHKPVLAVIGGLHLYAAADEQVDWTAGKLKSFGVRYLIGAHCTGIESLYRLRRAIGLTRQTAVVGAVGASFTLGEGIHAGRIAQ